MLWFLEIWWNLLFVIFSRPPPDRHEPFRGPNPNSWPSPQNLGPPSHVGNQGFTNQFPTRSGNMAVSSTPVRTLIVFSIDSSATVLSCLLQNVSHDFLCPIQGPIGVIPGSMDGSFPRPTVSSAPTSQFVSVKIKLNPKTLQFNHTL